MLKLSIYLTGKLIKDSLQFKEISLPKHLIVE